MNDSEDTKPKPIESLIGLYPPRLDLIGELITIRCIASVEEQQYDTALVIGYNIMIDGGFKQVHKLWYPTDTSVEDVELKRREWARNNPKIPQWSDDDPLLGKRIAIKRYNALNQSCACEEAFIVGKINVDESNLHKLLYTADDVIEHRVLGKQGKDFCILNPFDYHWGSTAVKSWTRFDSLNLQLFKRKPKFQIEKQQ